MVSGEECEGGTETTTFFLWDRRWVGVETDVDEEEEEEEPLRDRGETETLSSEGKALDLGDEEDEEECG